jgi:uncharacterized protein CbrC (UPF0167 family)
MFDYPAIRKFYFDKGAEKCASDPSGNGRFESAFYHTIKMVHDTVSAENAERIAVLEADNKTLKQEQTKTDDFINLLADHTEKVEAELIALKAQQGDPVAWIRLCSDGCYEGPIMNSQIEDVRKASGAWTPLHAAAAPKPKEPE